MASKQSFDISTGVDLQEVDNAVNQAIKESQVFVCGALQHKAAEL